jgi:hypothetical protein
MSSADVDVDNNQATDIGDDALGARDESAVEVIMLAEDDKAYEGNGGDSRGYPANIPKYVIGHSLGAKLHTIGIAATGIGGGDDLSGLGFVSYNNFGFADTTVSRWHGRSRKKCRPEMEVLEPG